MTQPVDNSRSSFFDDDDLNITFEFQKLEKSSIKDNLASITPKFFETLHRRNLQTNTFQAGVFGLVQRNLIYYKNAQQKTVEGVMELSNSRIARLQGVNNYAHGFSLSKNGNTYEFYHNDETVINNWFLTLRGFCVLTNFHDEYKAIKMIGKGSFAKVYLVESKQTGKSYAVKAFTKESVIISNKNNAKPSMINEIDIMRAVSHENIIQLYDVYETEKSIYLVLELIQGKSLQDLLKKSSFREDFNEIKCINMIRMILEALSYLASKNIMHRDLKPDNILYDKSDKIKIVDFGLATFINVGEYIFKKCGTPGYIAPEVFKYDAKNSATFYDDRCDVFSAGCILYYMLFGHPFFDGGNASEILKLNRKFTIEFESINTIRDELKNPYSKISKDGLNILLQILEFDHKKRLNASQSLAHHFFTPIPMDMYKNFQTGEIIGDPLVKSKEQNYIDKDSPIKFSSGKMDGSSPRNWKLPPDAIASLKTSEKANSIVARDKYAEKDSLYLDVGAPIMNGKIDTMTQGMGSANNSILLSQMGGSNANIASNSGSLSHFAVKTAADNKKGGKSYKVHTGQSGNQSFLKAAIFRNMQKNSEYGPMEETKDNSPLSVQSPVDNQRERRFSEGFSGLNSDFEKQRKSSHSPESGDYGDDVSNENPQVQINVEKMKTGTPDKHPSKMLQKKI